jgi:hypothetical protein
MNMDFRRRQAVAIASTLPDDIDDARMILRLAIELVDGFLSEGLKKVECGRVLPTLRADA